MVSGLSDKRLVSQLPHWSREEHHVFPAEFRAVVWQLVRGHYSAASLLNTLPMDVLELVIAHLARDPYSFPDPPAAGSAARKQKRARKASAPKRRAVAAAGKTK
jgi:hypothetical protein